jgi:hypothetical protein
MVRGNAKTASVRRSRGSAGAALRRNDALLGEHLVEGAEVGDAAEEDVLDQPSCCFSASIV